MTPRLSAIAFLVVALPIFARAGGASADPGPGFGAERYASLWTQSPFAIATPDAASAPSEYALVGLAQFGGISYASLIDKQTREHFVLASDKPVRNLTLVSVTHGPGGTSATVRRNGELLSLREEQAPPPPLVNGAGAPPAVQPLTRDLYSLRPAVRFHRRLIIIPSPPVK